MYKKGHPWKIIIYRHWIYIYMFSTEYIYIFHRIHVCIFNILILLWYISLVGYLCCWNVIYHWFLQCLNLKRFSYNFTDNDCDCLKGDSSTWDCNSWNSCTIIGRKFKFLRGLHGGETLKMDGCSFYMGQGDYGTAMYDRWPIGHLVHVVQSYQTD